MSIERIGFASGFGFAFQILVVGNCRSGKSLGQYFDIIEKRLSLVREENFDRTDSIRSRGRNVMEEKSKSENGQAE